MPTLNPRIPPLLVIGLWVTSSVMVIGYTVRAFKDTGGSTGASSVAQGAGAVAQGAVAPGTAAPAKKKKSGGGNIFSQTANVLKGLVP